VTTYITIGNTDNKLTQQEWSAFITDMVMLVLEHTSEVHFAGFSHPSAPYQNACWCVDFATPNDQGNARSSLAMLKVKYRQDSIAWADAQVSFV
jgi:hypothetical protein